ncbi:MAG: hypothetical protein MPJ22_10515 [Pirellulales bacterium]|nr:hypothetical protein [Pirellulales bacterium]
MNAKTLLAFFFWMTLLNFCILIISTGAVIVWQNEIRTLHASIFHLRADELGTLYFEYLGWYKALWMVLNVVPYVSLRIVLSQNASTEDNA